MKFRDFLRPEAIRIHMSAADKQGLIEKLVDLMAGVYKLGKPDDILKAVMERESLMSTGVGKGVALPHGKSDSVRELVGCLATVEPGVDFSSPDESPVRIAILLVAPSHETGPHIRALAHISRVLQDDSIRDLLILSKSPKEIFEILDRKEKDL